MQVHSVFGKQQHVSPLSFYTSLGFRSTRSSLLITFITLSLSRHTCMYKRKLKQVSWQQHKALPGWRTKFGSYHTTLPAQVQPEGKWLPAPNSTSGFSWGNTRICKWAHRKGRVLRWSVVTPLQNLEGDREAKRTTRGEFYIGDILRTHMLLGFDRARYGELWALI